MSGRFAARKIIRTGASVLSLVTNVNVGRHERMRGMNDAFFPLAPGQLAGLRVLVVEDRPEDRMLLVDFLTSQDCRVYVAEDGNDGYRKAQLVQPDIILMDVNMPVCDGLAACRLLKADQATRAIPLIFLTAACLPGERVAGLSAGAVDYVAKPFDFEEVRLRLLIHLRVAATPMPVPASSPAVAEASAEDGTSAAAAGATLDGVLFRAARKLLRERLDHTPELMALAQALNTNARRLNQAFRRCAGTTVFEFLREERMREARRLLCETSLDIQAISQAVGYGNRGNFSTAFRERFGMPPTALRQELDPHA
ncbi:Stalked cell differentiation-controlling protein [Achromobacter spanius]|nr:Sensor histidine kinase RcsC [Achromobacter spanius]SPT37821.1 Stalked cell differentiation-controlling protein [Achromobacter denitrificans]VEE55798.1 Stalked cell differentiation-controlling protein [Achromobacter spanius]